MTLPCLWCIAYIWRYAEVASRELRMPRSFTHLYDIHSLSLHAQANDPLNAQIESRIFRRDKVSWCSLAWCRSRVWKTCTANTESLWLLRQATVARSYSCSLMDRYHSLLVRYPLTSTDLSYLICCFLHSQPPAACGTWALHLACALRILRRANVRARAHVGVPYGCLLARLAVSTSLLACLLCYPMRSSLPPCKLSRLSRIKNECDLLHMLRKYGQDNYNSEVALLNLIVKGAMSKSMKDFRYSRKVTPGNAAYDFFLKQSTSSFNFFYSFYTMLLLTLVII